MSLTAARLQRLVRYRERLERLQEQRLGQAIRGQAERRARLDDARRDRGLALDHAASTDLVEMNARVVFIVRIDREIAAREAALVRATEVVAAEREALLERSRDRKAMETMHERCLEQERVERRRIDLKRLDDVAGRRWLDAE